MMTPAFALITSVATLVGVYLTQRASRRNQQLTIEANANEEGHLYGSVTEADISKTLKGKNLKVDPEMVKLEGMIKQCGLYEVELNLGYDITSKVKVMVVPLKQDKK